MGASVTKNTEPYGVYIGNPQKRLNQAMRFIDNKWEKKDLSITLMQNMIGINHMRNFRLMVN